MDIVTVLNLMFKSKNMYNDMVKLGELGKADSRDAKLLTPQTQLTKFKNASHNMQCSLASS